MSVEFGKWYIKVNVQDPLGDISGLSLQLQCYGMQILFKEWAEYH